MSHPHKYQLVITDIQTILMPEGAEVLAVQVQHERPCLWALVDPARPPTPRTFQTRGDEHGIASGTEGRYVGTYQVGGGSLVFHVFEYPLP